MIYTVTLNPALDHELTVDEIALNTVLRARASRVDVGGKGFNVSRMLQALGQASVALAFAGGDTGHALERDLATQFITPRFIWVKGETRTNVSIVSIVAGQNHIKVNEAGPTVHEADISRLLAEADALRSVGDTWILSGSLPPGAPVELYAMFCRLLNPVCRVIVDASGLALTHALAARPWLIKPNGDELAALLGVPAATLSNEQTVLAHARAALGMGAGQVLVSLGRDGAMFISPNAAFRASGPHIVEANPIGAGDCFTAGFVWATQQGRPPQDALRWACACGAAAASLPGTSVGPRTLVESLLNAVTVEPCAYA